ncbi:MAG: hypothetical protein HC860_08595 [Alkalinema sp. RU_4_3]|nr:hypothetical protein [Alkalinema sp. RU_4_3]
MVRVGGSGTDPNDNNRYGAVPSDVGLVLYREVPGIPAATSTDVTRIKISDKYKVEVCLSGTNNWQKVTAYQTGSQATVNQDITDSTKLNKGYYGHLKNWTHTYVNFEVQYGVSVDVKITSLSNDPLDPLYSINPNSSKAHPNNSAYNIRRFNQDTKSIVLTFTDPKLFAVDINGQMDNHHTGKGYTGLPIHTISIFANPVLSKPSAPSTQNILKAMSDGFVGALMRVPVNGKLIFAPGIHYIGNGVELLRGNRDYYIPGDAIVYGTLKCGSYAQPDPNPNAITIFGYGTLSASRVTHPSYTTPPDSKIENYRPIDFVYSDNCHVNGITIVDAPQLSVSLQGEFKGASISIGNTVRWVKTLNWRENSDGIDPGDNTKIENCFLRCQDDTIPTMGGRGIDRVVLWNDANGKSFITNVNGPRRDLTISNCTVIYARGIFEAGGGQVFALNQDQKPTRRKNPPAKVTFNDITIEDRFPTKTVLYLKWTTAQDTDPSVTEDCSFVGTTFNRLTIANPMGQVQMEKLTLIGGGSRTQIRDFTFRTLKVGSDPNPVTSLGFFNISNDTTNLMLIP